MTTEITRDVRARFNALAARVCRYQPVDGPLEWRYPMLSQVLLRVFVCPDCGPAVAVDEDGACSMCGADAEVHRNVGHCRTPLPLDTEANRYYAVGVLLEALSTHEGIEASWYRGRMAVYQPTPDTTGCISGGSNLEALVMALEALEGEHGAA